MDENKFPILESLVRQMGGKYLAERNFPVKLSARTVRRFHADVHIQYCLLEHQETPHKGTIKKAVKNYLEIRYDYVQEYVDHPFQPGKRMIVSAYYERRKTEE